MDELVSRGIILKQNNYGEAHRILSIFTESDGIIKAVRYGVRGKNTANAAAFQPFCYGDFRLRPSRTDMMTASSADILDGFFPLSEDISKLSLVAYLADITYALLGEGNPDSRILSLFLNIVYAAAYRDEPLIKLKTVYEIKLMSAGGFMPQLASCGICNGKPEYFCPDKGCVVCYEHRQYGDIPISDSVRSLMYNIAVCPDKKMLSFNVDEGLLSELNTVSERYVITQTDREYKSLKYFYAMSDL